MLKIHTQISPDWNASTYYRQLQPLAWLNKLGLAEVTIDRYDARQDKQATAEAMAYADINWFYQALSPLVTKSIEEAARWKSYWRTKDTWVPPVSFALDTDDDLFNVSPLNQAFRTLGIRVDGKDLEPGAQISTVDKDDKPFVLWNDKEDGFDIARNLESLRCYRQNLATSALVTCSTPRTIDYVRREAPGSNPILMPNCVDFSDYPEVELADKGQEVRMLWQGSPTHLEDLHPLRQSIYNLLERFPNLTLTIWGAEYIDPMWDQNRVKFIGWCDYREYKVRLACINHDINIAPLMPTTFNQSRSAIKVYESAALSRPIPTLAQNTAAYSDEMVEGETALLFNTPEEFEAKAAKLIEDAQLRRDIGQNCREWLKANRDPATWAQVLATQFTHARKVKADVWGPPPDEEVVLESVPPEHN